MKKIPNKIVTPKENNPITRQYSEEAHFFPKNIILSSESTSPWTLMAPWAQLTNKPDPTKTAVLSKGTFQKQIDFTPKGGQYPTPCWDNSPILELKKAQKNLTNKNASDTTKSQKPYVKFNTT